MSGELPENGFAGMASYRGYSVVADFFRQFHALEHGRIRIHVVPFPPAPEADDAVRPVPREDPGDPLRFIDRVQGIRIFIPKMEFYF